MMDRDRIVKRLESDLVGPLAKYERLDDGKPSDLYLMGILWPRSTRMGAEDDDRLDSAGGSAGSEDDTAGAAEEVPLSGLQRPCAAGLSCAVSGPSPTVDAEVSFALYELEELGSEDLPSEIVGPAHSDGEGSQSTEKSTKRSARRIWVRRPFHVLIPAIDVSVNENRREPIRAEGLPRGVALHVRATAAGPIRLATLTIVNELVPAEMTSLEIERNTLFQVELVVRPGEGCALVPKPDMVRAGDGEEASASLLYRACRTFAAGHTCSAIWTAEQGAAEVSKVRTTWLPQYEVPRVDAGGHPAFARLTADPDERFLEAAWLGAAGPEQLATALLSLVACYDEWVELQEKEISGLPAENQQAARENLNRCHAARDRMAHGAQRIVSEEALRTSFQLANRALQLQHEWNRDRAGRGPLVWRPFQLGFVILSAASVCDDADDDRGIMDLLWFPTGGGKTEAYLALIAMLAFYRRLSTTEPDSRAGVSAVMRYTLRLLTTQQFERASALILACEAIRRSPKRSGEVSARLGGRPFGIGLWVGDDASPNKYQTAVKALSGDRGVASPEQLTLCPCCGSRLAWSANTNLERIEVRCSGEQCELGAGGHDPLPVWTVDDDLYRERPTLVIGTIDKFAQLPRKKSVRALFGMGTPDTPDLVIQDELHLISGPLGTVAAVYETAFDWLIRRGDRRAKIIGSTATIRRAADQTRALFNRESHQFPPPGLDHRDSGFAVVDGETPGRLYVGVTTAGRSAKFTLQAVTGCLLQAAAGEIADLARRDPYSTLVGYFNSLRELGGALVLVQDDVNDSIKLYATRHGEILRQISVSEELTSRRTQDEVREMLGKLATRVGQDGAVDIVLATNMVSVGVDVPRLGLMLVNGQPKTRSEYIQATSRVGRDKAPGLVVSVLNNAKPRDRSHYETFPGWHESLYRDVEATSVTPFASRARDRALHAALASMVRHGVAGLEDTPTMNDTVRAAADSVVDEIVARAAQVDPAERRVRSDTERRLNDWEARQPSSYWNDDRQKRRSLMQSAEEAATQRALGRAVGDAWPTMNNMRSVEPSVAFRLAERLRNDLNDEEEDD